MSVYATPRGDLAIDIDGVRFPVDDLDLDRLHACLVDVSEDATSLRLHEHRDPDNAALWGDKAAVAEQQERDLRELIREKRGQK